jgi:uncharacterized lipoprotein NlpE involved in copper resistance
MLKFLIIILLFGSSLLIGQTDTVFRTDGRSIPCTITLVNENALFFKDKKGIGDQLEFKSITQYSKNGVLTRVNVPTDTAYNALFVDNVNINKLDLKYCELVNLDVGFTGGNAYIYVDYGQFIENAQKVTIRNNKGTAVYFNSIVGALNFMEKNGWEYVGQSSSTNSIALGKTAAVYKILLKRKP